MTDKISIILLCYNAGSTLEPLFNSLLKQNNPELIREIIVINDNSNDNTSNLIDVFSKKGAYKIRGVVHDQTRGLAYGYNEGINLSNGEYFILMHQDVVLEDGDSYAKMLEPLSGSYIVSSPFTLYPRSVWNSYGFWQKYLFSRFVDGKFSTLSGKFNCFRKDIFVNQVGLFDYQTFRTAGEDVDIQLRLKQAGFKIAEVNIEIIHLHNKSKNFNFWNVQRKEAQLAEANGVLLRRYGPLKLGPFSIVYFRQVLLLLLILPIANLFAILLILIYSFAYSKKMFVSEYKNPRVILLPFANMYLLFVSLFYCARGFIHGKQII